MDATVLPVSKIGFLTDTHLRPGADEINDRTRKVLEVLNALERKVAPGQK